jgi:hypothetical protein
MTDATSTSTAAASRRHARPDCLSGKGDMIEIERHRAGWVQIDPGTVLDVGQGWHCVAQDRLDLFALVSDRHLVAADLVPGTTSLRALAPLCTWLPWPPTTVL